MTRSSRKESLREIGEDALIRRIAKLMRPPAEGAFPPVDWRKIRIEAGIGDDTAIVRPSPESPPLAITTDMLVEGVHFLASHPAEALGAKAVEANLSDLASAGAWPAWILVSLGAPGTTPAQWVEDLYRGMRRAMRPYGCLCIGGDCVRAEKLTINIVAGGNCDPQSRAPLRSRAKPGQSLYVTGTLGDSGAGLYLLQNPKKFRRLTVQQQRDSKKLIARHEKPTARVRAGIAIARLCKDAAMMDLSDGLATDLPRMARAAHCGFRIDTSALPLSQSLKRMASLLPHTPEAYALYGGEDYELVFATSVPPDAWMESVKMGAPGGRLRVTRIGEVAGGEEAQFLDSDGANVGGADKFFKHF